LQGENEAAADEQESTQRGVREREGGRAEKAQSVMSIFILIRYQSFLLDKLNPKTRMIPDPKAECKTAPGLSCRS
jgi:hypothetical protein